MSRTSFSLIEKGQLPKDIKARHAEVIGYQNEFPEKYEKLVKFCATIDKCDLNAFICCSK